MTGAAVVKLVVVMSVGRMVVTVMVVDEAVVLPLVEVAVVCLLVTVTSKHMTFKYRPQTSVTYSTFPCLKLTCMLISLHILYCYQHSFC